MKQEFELCRAERKDSERIDKLLRQTALWLKSKGSSQWNEILEGADAHNTLSAIDREEVFYGTIGNEMVGMFILWDHQSGWDAELWGKDTSLSYAYLHRLTILRSYASKDVSVQLMDSAKRTAKQNHKKAIRLDCFANSSYVNQFYRRMGFRFVESLKDFDTGKQLADYNLYQFDLD